MLRLRLIILCLLTLLLSQQFLPAVALAGSYASQDVKVAFTYNFAKFVNWPNTDDSTPLTIGILGQDPFGPALLKIKNKSVHGKPLTIRSVRTLEEAKECQLLFFSRSESNRLKRWLINLKNQPVLTVSDINGFAEQGGMLELEETDQRIQFLVNLEQITAANLHVDAQLLKLAAKVLQAQGEQRP